MLSPPKCVCQTFFCGMRMNPNGAGCLRYWPGMAAASLSFPELLTLAGLIRRLLHRSRTLYSARTSKGGGVHGTRSGDSSRSVPTERQSAIVNRGVTRNTSTQVGRKFSASVLVAESSVCPRQTRLFTRAQSQWLALAWCRTRGPLIKCLVEGHP